MEEIDMKKVISFVVIFISSLHFSACGGGGADSDFADAKVNNKEVEITSIGSSINLNEEGEYNLTITGSGNDVEILEGNKINILEITGTNNDIVINANTTVETFTITGSNNDVFVPNGSVISFEGSGSNNQLITRTTNTIEGEWVYVYPSSQCEETYVFYSDKTFIGSSLDERFEGVYSFEDTVVSGDEHSLSITITSDNTLPDCNGSTTNETGNRVDVSVNFIGSNAMEWLVGGEDDLTIILNRN